MTTHLLPFTDPVETDRIPPHEMVSADGARVTDVHGNTYLDAVAGLWCASLGFNPPRLQQAAADQMGRLAFYHSFMGRTASPTTALANRLVEKLPQGLEHVFFGTSGSEAVENAVKFARYFQIGQGKPRKMKIIAREGAYHGSGHISAALTGMSYCHDGFHLPSAEVLRTGRAHYFGDGLPGESESAFSKRRAAELEALILREGADTICAFIGEPLMGSGGVFIPPEGYWLEVQAVLKRHGILLIADEIITGFGRTGRWFGSETFGLKPDLMTMAKQLTGGVFPMSAVAMTAEIFGGISKQAHELGTFGHGVTYGGHPVGAAVALETLQIYEEMNLPTHVGRLGDHLTEHLKELIGLPHVADVRSVGLVGAVEFVEGGKPAADVARAVGQDAQRRGVLFRIINNVLAISPPYVCTTEDINQMIDTMVESIKAKPRQAA